MLKTVEGVYRNGRVELLEAGPAVGEARVIVTFLAVKADADVPPAGRSGGEAAVPRGTAARWTSAQEDWQGQDSNAHDTL